MDNNNLQKNEKIKEELLKKISVKDILGQWHNNIPTYKEHIVNRIKDWLNVEGNKIAIEARQQGWLSLTGKVSYENYTIPCKDCESLVGYLHLVLKKQYFLFYGIQCVYNGLSYELMEIQKWLNSKAFKDDLFRNYVNPIIIYKPEHIQLIKTERGIA